MLGSKCSSCCECCNRTVTYTLADTEPPGLGWDECPTSVNPCDSANPGSCAGEVWEGFIAETFRTACIGTRTLKAWLQRCSTIDNHGTVAGIETTEECGTIGKFIEGHDVTDAIVFEVDEEAGTTKAKIPATAVNDLSGGPYGLAAVTICWCCKEPEDPTIDETCCPEVPPCEPVCGVIEASAGGFGTTVNTYEFPSTEHCIWVDFDAYGIPDRIIVKIGGNTVWDTGIVPGRHTRCILKPEGETSVEVTVEGPDPSTQWQYTLVCDGCPAITANYCCRNGFDCQTNNPALQSGYVAFCEYVEPPEGKCANSSAGCGSGGECDYAIPTPIAGAPYDCRNGLVAGGVWVTVSGYSHYDGDRSEFSECEQSVMAAIEGVLNGSFFVPLPCFGVANQYEIHGTTSCCGVSATYTVYISLNLCQKYVEVSAYLDPCSEAATGGTPVVQYQGEPLEMTPMSCNDFSACFCASYGGPVSEFPGAPVVNVTVV